MIKLNRLYEIKSNKQVTFSKKKKRTNQTHINTSIGIDKKDSES